MTRVREWKPGDVIDVDGERAFIQAMSNGDLHVEFADYGTLGGCYLKNLTTQKVRPLVVIDPEDPEQVERLLVTYHAQYPIKWGDDNGAHVINLQAALREFADPKPTRPEEPTGLGAVVEDRDGRTWVHVGPGSSFAIWVPTALVDRIPRSYAAIDAVKVLSDGIPA